MRGAAPATLGSKQPPAIALRLPLAPPHPLILSTPMPKSSPDFTFEFIAQTIGAAILGREAALNKKGQGVGHGPFNLS